MEREEGMGSCPRWTFAQNNMRAHSPPLSVNKIEEETHYAEYDPK